MHGVVHRLIFLESIFSKNMWKSQQKTSLNVEKTLNIKEFQVIGEKYIKKTVEKNK